MPSVSPNRHMQKQDSSTNSMKKSFVFEKPGLKKIHSFLGLPMGIKNYQDSLS